jgi:hypothetical protein
METETWIPATVLGLASVAAVSVYLILKIVWGRRYNLPPRPWAWPIVGNLLQLRGGNGLYYKLLEFRQAYGDVFRLKLGIYDFFFVFGHQNVQEILVKHGDVMTKKPNWMYIPDRIFKKKGKIICWPFNSVAGKSADGNISTHFDTCLKIRILIELSIKKIISKQKDYLPQT